LSTINLHINWQQQALDFLIGISPIKNIRNQKQMVRELFELVDKVSKADIVGFYRNTDSLTTRVVLSSERNVLQQFLNPQLVGPIIQARDYQWINPAYLPFFIKDTQIQDCCVVPLYNAALSGGMIIGWKQKPSDTEGLEQFLNALQLGMSDLMKRMSVYYEIEELTTRFNAILETIPQGVVYVDDSGKTAWINAVSAELLTLSKGYNTPFAVANAMQRLRLSAANQEDINTRSAELFSRPEQTISDWEWQFGKPISKVLSITCKPISSQLVKGRLWVFTDVTFNYLAKIQLEQLNAELAEKRLLAEEQSKAKSDFLANMSHEIRTPMNGVIGMTSLLGMTKLDDEQRDFVETIRLSGETLLAIINDILDLSKIEANKMELEQAPLSITKTIEDTYDLLSIKANEKSLDLLYLIDPKVPDEILGDATRMGQILLNLVSNGIKFTAKGEICINVDVLHKEANKYTIGFKVTDTGIGIPANKLKSIFESFSQADSSTTRKYGGTGLGLAICTKLVKLMGGDILVESTEGKGSTFAFSIKAEATTTQKLAAFSQQETEALANKKILLLDDNFTNLRILETQLRYWNAIPYAFSDCHAAIEALSKQDFDLAILDMLMEKKTGIEVAAHIRTLPHNANVPLILFSSLSYSLLKDKAEKALFSAILIKPAKHDLLRKTIIGVLSNTTELAENKQADNGTKLISNTHELKILVAEDNETNQKLIRKTLEKLGYEATIVATGKEAVEVSSQQIFDLILMDIMMPEMDGYEAARRIKQRTEQHPVIIAITANALSEDKDAAFEAGMDDYISKPFKVKDIEEKIAKWRAHKYNNTTNVNHIN
jgi:signal transduction histidine kinase/CheY-like chemotaxis protein